MAAAAPLSFSIQHSSSLPRPLFSFSSYCDPVCNRGSGNATRIQQHRRNTNNTLLLSSNTKHLVKPISAVGSSSGLEASIADPKDNAITVKNANIVVESQQGNQMQVRVDLPGEETEKVFGKVLTNLASSAPPIPGFRRQKGGKTTKVPREFLLKILGEERVVNFVIQEIVTSTMADYVKKENLKVKDNKISTTQKADELRKLFTPRNQFSFNVIMELEETKTDSEASS